MTQPVTSDAFGKFQVRKASDIKYGVNMMLYSKGGAGKSTFAAGAADSEFGRPVLFLDAEGGSRAIAHRDDITVIDMETWKSLEDFTAIAGKQPTLPWKTVVMDNCSEFVNLITKTVVGSDETAPSQPQWGKVAMEFISFIRDWRTIGTKTGTNIIFIAWDDDSPDELGRRTHELQMTPKLKKEIPGMVDIIGLISVADKAPYLRTVDFAPSSRTANKFRRSQSEAALSVPLKVEYSIDQHPMADILNVLRGGQEWPTAKYAKKTEV